MKKILYLLPFFLFVSAIYPQTYYLNVNLKNGTKVTYEIANINKIDFSGVTSINDAQRVAQIIKVFKVMQNYPNPFNPSTTIQYEIPQAGKVEIHIFDINGRLVKTLENQNNLAGSYKVVWDGNNESGVKVSSGFYLYSLKYENTIVSKKMIPVK